MIENDKMNIKQYKDVEQPFTLPNNLDLFSWSLPFLTDKLAEMMDHLIQKNVLVGKKEIKSAKEQSKNEFQKVIKDLKEEKT